MLIVDAQIHLWEKGTPSAHHRQEPYSAEQAIAGMNEAGVDRALIHPVLWDPDSNELALKAVRKYPDRFAIMGWFYLDDPNGRNVVAHWKERTGMLGLRFYTNERHPQSWFTDGTLDWLWPAAERAQVPVALGAAMFLPTVGKIAERHPGLKLIVDHMGVPRASKGEAAYRLQPELLAFAKYPNIAVKATGQAGCAEDAYPFRSLHPHLRRCFDAFGPERMFWGTDITRMQCSWRQCVTLFTEELPWLKGRDLELVMGEAVCKFLGWPFPAGGNRRRSINATSHPAEGSAGHILRVDENMSMDVDQLRRHQPAFDGHGAACFRGRQRGPDRDDLATGDPDIYDSSEPRGGIEHFAAGK